MRWPWPIRRAAAAVCLANELTRQGGQASPAGSRVFWSRPTAPPEDSPLPEIVEAAAQDHREARRSPQRGASGELSYREFINSVLSRLAAHIPRQPAAARSWQRAHRSRATSCATGQARLSEQARGMPAEGADRAEAVDRFDTRNRLQGQRHTTARWDPSRAEY